jgi:hypothetical protein
LRINKNFKEKKISCVKVFRLCKVINPRKCKGKGLTLSLIAR